MTNKLSKIVFFLIGLSSPLAAKAVNLPNPLGGNVNTPEDLIANVIKTILGITGSIALIMFVYGGFMWMTSAGNSDRVAKGKNVFVWATVGLIVIFSSYAILRTVFSIFQ